ncbi:phage portal protein [Phytomonospora sp. NPDC050363]|uniref:phage portal protein n=1 Tax=Phytomonospora sp. NPDC050363 TaxID=3155642 RepID=UPI0033D848CC
MDQLKYLLDCHKKELTDLRELNAHYEGTMDLSYIHPELLAELDDRLQQVVINWPELVVDSLDERLDVEGFRLRDAAEADDDLWDIWQFNDLDEVSQQGHVDALVMKRAFTITGANDEVGGLPLVTVESPLQVYADFDSRTRAVTSAVKTWKEDQPEGPAIEYASLYLPNETSWWLRKNGQWVLNPDFEPDMHDLGVVPVVPIVNRPRLKCPGGRSELASIVPLSMAANKIATDMMVSAEFHAMPRRYVLGADEADFTDEHNRPVTGWSKVAGRVWAMLKGKNEGAEVGQFPEANLSNFHETLNQLARIVASLGALPPQFLGFSTDNPASADAIRSSEARLVKRAERRQRAFGGAWERTMRIAHRIQTSRWDDSLHRLETLWRDASTPTVAQKADASTKLHAAGIVPTEQTREDLGYTSVQRARMRKMDAADARRAMGEDVPDDDVLPGEVPVESAA